jgi:tetratricopeptide (TPR) repeat protein
VSHLYPEAIAEFEQAVNNSNRAPQPLISLGHAYAVSGNKVEAQKVLAAIRDLSQEHYVSPYGVAAIYVGLGEKEQAFDWLEKAFDEGNTELTFLLVDPRLDPLRDDRASRSCSIGLGFSRELELDESRTVGQYHTVTLPHRLQNWRGRDG